MIVQTIKVISLRCYSCSDLSENCSLNESSISEKRCYPFQHICTIHTKALTNGSAFTFRGCSEMDCEFIVKVNPNIKCKTCDYDLCNSSRNLFNETHFFIILIFTLICVLLKHNYNLL